MNHFTLKIKLLLDQAARFPILNTLRSYEQKIKQYQNIEQVVSLILNIEDDPDHRMDLNFQENHRNS